MFDAFDEITDLACLLKFHFGCKILHLFFKIPDYVTVIAVQETDGLLYVAIVVFFGYISLAGSVTLLDLVIQAWTFKPHIFGKVFIAASDMIQLFQELNYILDRLGIGVWTKIL